MMRLLALALPAGFAGTAVLTEGGRALDAAGLEGLRSLPAEWAVDTDRLVRSIDHAATSTWATPLVVAFVVGLILHARHRANPARRTLRSVPVAWSIVVAVVIGALAKVALPRPVVDDAILASNSLPSGHTLGFAAVATIVGLWATTQVPAHRVVRALLAAGLVSWAVVIMVTTGHRPADVVAGLLVVEAAVVWSARIRPSKCSAVVVTGFAALALMPGVDAPAGGAGAALVAACWMVAVAASSVGLADTFGRCVQAPVAAAGLRPGSSVTTANMVSATPNSPAL